ncbi:MAG: DEAD/DEAH box helicase [Chlamydiae bacterium]|nr:DEAD/DEAH box helicase [Chlamydiota bacterium]
MGFTRLNLHKKILDKLEKLGFSSPTPIQNEAIPHILEGKDLLACADTGTGKTAAFLLPTIHMLLEKSEEVAGPKVLILSPTRELAAQIEKEVIRFSSGLSRIRSVVVFGGAGWTEQVKKVSKPHDILVATPGRLIDLMEKKKVDLSQIQVLVIDEADRMLDMGFIEPVNLIASNTHPDRQTLLFSATLKGPVLNLCKNLTIDPVRVEIEKEKKEVENIKEHFYFTNDIAHKHRVLSEILQKENVNQAIIFAATKRSTEELSEKLNEEGFEASALHGDMKQRQRDRTLKYLRNGEIRILVATDVAARGIDVSTITHVINFDLPKQVEDYVHRIGRTGRAGAEGEAHSFASKRDRAVVTDIEKIMNKTYDIFSGDKNPTREKKGKNFSEGRDRPKFSRERKSEFGDRERRPFGDRKEFGDRERRPFGDRKEFGDRERRSFGDRKEFGDRERRSFGDRKEFGDRERRPFGDRKEFGDRERRPFGDRKEFGDRERRPFGDRKEFGDRERRPFGDRKEFGSKKSFSKDDKFKESGFKMVGGAKKSKSFSLGKYDLEMPSKDGRSKRPSGPKRGKKVFTAPKKNRYS